MTDTRNPYAADSVAAEKGRWRQVLQSPLSQGRFEALAKSLLVTTELNATEILSAIEAAHETQPARPTAQPAPQQRPESMNLVELEEHRRSAGNPVTAVPGLPGLEAYDAECARNISAYVDFGINLGVPCSLRLDQPGGPGPTRLGDFREFR